MILYQFLFTFACNLPARNHSPLCDFEPTNECFMSANKNITAFSFMHVVDSAMQPLDY